VRIPLRWLSEYVDLTVETGELARRLTVAGAEVGEIITTADWEGVVVAHVDKIEQHPNADRLVIATVDNGSGEPRRVVCGAPNVRAGQNIAYAAIGSKLIDGHTGESVTLKTAKIRGVESQGMICSEKELGMSDQHEGILVLPADAPLGAPLAEVIGDTVFDIEVTANRPDWLSILGVAREVAALTARPWRDPSIQYPESAKSATKFAKVEIADPDLCPRYVGAIVENVKVGESPPWMQDRLIAAGMRPISNVVDITNYVMLEMGQPLHAFDYEKVRGKKIVVRRAQKGERIKLLDGSRHKLTEEMLVIADGEGATAVAGVMGGGDSEVSAKTKTILLESANFSGPSIRRTSQALKLRTDASTRFEKGLSRLLPPIAIARAVKLVVELCGGRAAQGLIDCYPAPEKESKITLTMARIERVLGLDIPATQVRQVLTSLGFGCRWMPPDRFIVRVPYWRTDVRIPDDVIEEIARVIGYDELPTSRLRGAIADELPQPLRALRERVRDVMAAAGLQEVITYSMTDLESLAKVLPAEDLAVTPPLRVANPLSRQFEYARTTLRHALLQTLSANIGGTQDLISLYEASRVYIPAEGDLPHETETLTAVVSGRIPDRWGQPTGDLADFFDAKGALDTLFAELRLEADYREATDFAYLPGRTAEIFVGDTRVGIIGHVHPGVAAAFDIERDVIMFEIDIEALLPHVQDVVHFRPMSPYPTVEEDLALVVAADIPAASVVRLMQAFPLVAAVRIFDVYTGEPVPSGKKSLAFAVTYQALDRTLTEADVSKQRGRIIERLRRELSAEPRT